MSEKVKVACRVPNGLALRLYRETTWPESDEKRFVPCGDYVTIAGPGPHAQDPQHTEVDKEFWEEWLKQNPHHSAVESEQLFSINDPVKDEE